MVLEPYQVHNKENKGWESRKDDVSLKEQRITLGNISMKLLWRTSDLNISPQYFSRLFKESRV